MDIEKLLFKIEAIPEKDRKTAKRIIDILVSEGLSVSRCLRYIAVIKAYSAYLGEKTIYDAGEDDLRGYLSYMISQGRKDEGIETDVKILKRIYRLLFRDNKEKILWLDNIRFKVKRRKLPEILTPDEIKKLIDNAQSLRDKTLISMAWEGGFRASELLNIRLKDIEMNGDSCYVKVDGKTGQRRVVLVESLMYLKPYISTMKPDPEAYLFPSKYNKGRPITIAGLTKALKNACKRSGITKHLHPHILRHSRATFLARFLTESQLKQFFGWTQDSKMAARYIHMSVKDLETDYKAIYEHTKVEKKQEKVRVEFKECWRCKEKNKPGAGYCWRCGAKLDMTISEVMAKKRIEDALWEIVSMIAEMPEVRERLKRVLETG